MARPRSDEPGTDLDALRALAQAELPALDSDALSLPGGRGLRIALSSDVTGLESFRVVAASGGAPLAALAVGPAAGVDAFGATAHHLGAPALGYDLRASGGSAVLAAGEPEPNLACRLEGWRAPSPAPEGGAAAEGGPASTTEGLAVRLVARARAARVPDVETRLDGSLGGRTRFVTSQAEAGLMEDGLALALESVTGDGDPFWAAVEGVARVARRLACVGAEPLGLALRFGVAPQEGAGRVEQACMGVRQACLSLALPLAGVAVEPGGPDLLVAGVGLVEGCLGPVDLAAPDAKGLALAGARCAGRRGRKALDGLFLLGPAQAQEAEGLALDLELRLQACVREGVRLGLLRSAAEVEAGGLLGSAADVAGAFGVQLFLAAGTALGSEAPGRVLATAGGEGEGALRTLCATHGVPLAKVGVLGGGRLALALGGDPVVDLEI